MTLAALLLAALVPQAQVFPEPLCENLPEVRPEVKTWVAQVAPELAQVRVRELPEKTALDGFRRAAAAGWGSIDVLTHGVFREPCTFYLSREALRAVDAAFDLDLLTVIRGQDRKGQDFEMAALLAGRGKLVVFYDRDGIVYRNERLDRAFTLASRVGLDTPVAGALENVHGLCAKVLLFGCVRIHSIVKVGETIEVRAGTFTSAFPLEPIQPREGRAGHAPAARAEAGYVRDPALVEMAVLPGRSRQAPRLLTATRIVRSTMHVVIRAYYAALHPVQTGRHGSEVRPAEVSIGTLRAERRVRSSKP
jgi:hypothetical protein